MLGTNSRSASLHFSEFLELLIAIADKVFSAGEGDDEQRRALPWTTAGKLEQLLFELDPNGTVFDMRSRSPQKRFFAGEATTDTSQSPALRSVRECIMAP